MLKVKKETIVKSLFTTILAVGFASNVSAVTARVTQDTKYLVKEGSKPCDYPIISSDMIQNGKCVNKDKKTHIGGGEIFTIEGIGTAYCIDPGYSSPSGNYTISEIKGEDDFLKGASQVCAATKDKPGLRVTALKAYSSTMNFAKNTDEAKGYRNFNTSAVVLNPDKAILEKYGLTDKKEIINIVKNGQAAAKNGSTKSNVTITSNEKSRKIYVENNVEGTITITNANSYTITVDGSKYTSGMTLAVGNHTIVVSDEGCKSGEIEVSFNYEESASIETNNSTAKLYKLTSTDKKKVTDLQRLLVCDDSSSNSCENGICVEKAKLNVTCQEEPVCDPNVVVHNQDEYCDKDGETIVLINTNGTNDLACAKDPKYGIKATPQLIGNNELCEVYCVEDYELSLPGPDATKDDANVKITSGTFFTIDEKNMTGKTTVKCYNVLKPEALAEKINLARQGSVNKFNDNSLKNAYGAATCEKNSNDDGYSIKGGTYEFATLNTSTGKIEVTKKSVNNGISYNSESKCNEEKAKIQNSLSGQSFSDDLINQYMKSYEECTNWDFTKAFKNSLECSADITFEYYSGMDFNVDIVGKTSIGSSNIEKANKSEKIYTGVCTETSCGNANQQTSIASGVSVGTISANTEYTFDNYFVSNLETGELIKVKKDYTPGKNESAVVQGFPIDLKVPQGKYQYRYTYRGIGHYFDDNSGECKTGRLDKLLTGDNNNFNCSIDVNGCNDCKFDCGPDGTGENCDMDQDDCVECKFACVGVGCIMNGNSGFLATYRTLSLNDPSLLTLRAGVTPATLLAYNNNPSSTDDYDRVTNSKKTNWSTAKGKMAAGKITNDGEKIYDKDPEYSVTINAKSKKIIKDYNKEQKNYLSSKLNCELVEGSYGICESTLLDKLASDKNASIKGRNYGNEKDPYGNVKYPGKQDSFVGPAYK